MLPVREGLERGHTIITDRSQPVPLFTQVSHIVFFQLDELGFAKQSPVENQQRTLEAGPLQVLSLPFDPASNEGSVARPRGRS